MKRKVILPFVDQPLNLMYHSLAFPMGIIQGNAKEDITPWLCGRYVNCMFTPNQKDNKFQISLSDNWATADMILSKQSISLFSHMYHEFHMEILWLFCRMLENGYYVHGCYNEEYIPHKWAYGKQYYCHDFLLIGFNNVEKVFYSVGYLDDGKFHRYEIPYNNMLDSIVTLDHGKPAFNFWSFQKDADLSLNLFKVTIELEGYLNSTTSQKLYSVDKFFGLCAIDRLQIYFQKQAEQGYRLDHRYTRGLMEHKYFMELRMEYLNRQGILNRNTDIQYASEVYRISQKVHMLGLKYTMTGNQKTLFSLIDLISRMNERERKYLPAVLDDLKKQVGTGGMV